MALSQVFAESTLETSPPSDGVEVEIYCDGATGNKLNPKGKKMSGTSCATWGFVVVIVKDKVRHLLVGYWGTVITDPEHPEFIGAKKQTSQTAELSAMNWSLRWLTARKDRIKHSTIYSDSTYAIRSTDESYKKDLKNAANVQLIQNTRAVYDKVLVDLCWIKGHSGNKWNHLADYLAQHAKKNTGIKAKRQRVGRKKLKAWTPKALLN